MTQVIENVGGEWGNRTPVHGFAIRTTFTCKRFTPYFIGPKC